MKNSKKNKGRQKSKGTKKAKEVRSQCTAGVETQLPMSSMIVTNEKKDVAIDIDHNTPLLPREDDFGCGCYEIQSYAVATVAAGVALGSIAAALWIFYQIVVERRPVEHIFSF
ncbi:hypothetical protein QAD02_010673 [Eretmocerus hayati]|uniref:Uncharacterized protein n=1 Tax=Eretmocerus hayati TaxID=131215 RepID=A0ACC2NUT0_9HYME|nr:hypothetical protein QAD02_010673 [Eretmocerus hayati]